MISSNKLHQHTAVRKIRICAGHRIEGHENKCADFHGHDYCFEIHARVDELDSVGRVVDFGVIKEVVGWWIDTFWDHAMLLWVNDPYAYMWNNGGVLHGMKVFYLPYNPTAENLASFMLEKANELLVAHGHATVKVVKVVCYETPNCSAVAEL